MSDWEKFRTWYEARLTEEIVSAGRTIPAGNLWIESYSLEETRRMSEGVPVQITEFQSWQKFKTTTRLLE